MLCPVANRSLCSFLRKSYLWMGSAPISLPASMANSLSPSSVLRLVDKAISAWLWPSRGVSQIDLDAYSDLLLTRLHRLPGVRQVHTHFSLQEFKGQLAGLPVE